MKSGERRYSSRKNLALRRRLRHPRHIQSGRTIPYYQTNRGEGRNKIDYRLRTDWGNGED